ncbi:alpha/beta hydrolase [uncultured Hyphomonas sp.]|uniref:alpha/beta fold hydrolase n=1 Tax=uncultured Hyphomonas sp. TaxID=225298 RepID=UPI002AAAE9CD|nr:alpha/beta hydrolase [uncultured Hyphomonas sp.]
MPRIRANGLEIEYEETGSPDDPMILLVSGYMGQMTEWPDSFKQALADAGRRVVVFDNRDIGLTTAVDDPSLEDIVPPDAEALMQGAAEGAPVHEQVPYVLDEMAADAAALIEALGAEKADVLGLSMGGMIVQLMALNHPERVRTLMPVMTTSGDPDLPPTEPEALEALTAEPESETLEAIGELAVSTYHAIGSHPDLRNPDDELRSSAIADVQRANRPLGLARQFAALLAQPRWHDRLETIQQPTLVLHGAMDRLIPPEGGHDIARRVPGAEIKIVDKWGHDLPEKVVPELLKEILPFLERASLTQPA